jgi:hypothetical protein
MKNFGDMKYSLLRDTTIRLDGKTYVCEPIHEQLKCKILRQKNGGGWEYIYS